MSLKEGSPYSIELDSIFGNGTDQMIEVRVVLKPIKEVCNGFSLLELVCTGDAKAK